MAERIVGAYQIDVQLAEGATGVVYRAESERGTVALKVLAPERVAHPDALARFLDEHRTLAGLAHPNLIEVYDAGRDGDRVYLAMRLATGGTLRDRLTRERRLAPLRVGRIVRQLADALAYLHERGLVHLDVKPGNVLLVEGDWPLLGDFGLARISATADGGPIGTPGYMAPEQERGAPLDGHADQYALAVLAWECLTGSRPHRSGERAPSAPAISPAVGAVLWRGMAPDPTDRFERIETFADALADAIETEEHPLAAPGSPAANWSDPRATLAAMARAIGRGLLPPTLAWTLGAGGDATSRADAVELYLNGTAPAAAESALRARRAAASQAVRWLAAAQLGTRAALGALAAAAVVGLLGQTPAVGALLVLAGSGLLAWWPADRAARQARAAAERSEAPGSAAAFESAGRSWSLAALAQLADAMAAVTAAPPTAEPLDEPARRHPAAVEIATRDDPRRRPPEPVTLTDDRVRARAAGAPAREPPAFEASAPRS